MVDTYTEADLARAGEAAPELLGLRMREFHHKLARLIASVRKRTILEERSRAGATYGSGAQAGLEAGRRAGLEEAAQVAIEVQEGLTEKGFHLPAGGASDVWRAIRAVADEPASGASAPEPPEAGKVAELEAEVALLRGCIREVRDALADGDESPRFRVANAQDVFAKWIKAKPATDKPASGASAPEPPEGA